jgi:hypothetical protein
VHAFRCLLATYGRELHLGIKPICVQAVLSRLGFPKVAVQQAQSNSAELEDGLQALLSQARCAAACTSAHIWQLPMRLL